MDIVILYLIKNMESRRMIMLLLYQWLLLQLVEGALPPRNCEELRLSGETRNGLYAIDPDQGYGEPPFQVKCDLGVIPALDIIEHNYPNTTEVIDAPDFPNGNTYNVTYQEVNRNQWTRLIEESDRCWQYLRYDCHHSVISHVGNMYAGWYDRNSTKMQYWAGGPPTGRGCACGIDNTCDGGSTHWCHCEANDEVWRSDEGFITESFRLPATKLFFVDTNSPHEMGHFTLGPLTCEGRNVPWSDWSQSQCWSCGDRGNRTRYRDIRVCGADRKDCRTQQQHQTHWCGSYCRKGTVAGLGRCTCPPNLHPPCCTTGK